MSRRPYAGKRQAQVRARAAAMLPAPCFRCGRIVTAEMNWHADHTLSRAEAQAAGIPDVEVDQWVQPSHASCNTRANKRVGATPETRAANIQPLRRPKMEKVESFSEQEESPQSPR